jgi:hypothetical protein
MNPLGSRIIQKLTYLTTKQNRIATYFNDSNITSLGLTKKIVDVSMIQFALQ